MIPLARSPRLAARTAAAILAVLLCTFSLAQELNPAAREALQRARAAAAEAQATYIESYPDQPLWQQAFRHGREAQRQAPGHPEPLRFLGEAYTLTKWYGPAWNTWEAFLRAGGDLDRAAREFFVTTGTELGYIQYRQGNLDEALRFYSRVIDEVPGALDAYVWVGRILIETERPRQAIAYWQEVADRDPTDARARYFLELAQDQSRWGVDAANAFREGVSLFEQGQFSEARERFARAARMNPEYAAAWAWQGRIEFERGAYRNAETFYDNALQFDPANETYRYFRDESRRRLG